MKRLLSGGLVAASALLLAACGSSSNNNDEDPIVIPPDPDPVAQLQVVHASADAPAVNVLVNGEVALPGVPFAVASPTLELPVGTISADVNAIFPDATEATVLSVPELTLAEDVIYTVIAAGSTAGLLAEGDNPLQLHLLTRPVLEAIDGVRIQVLHGSPSAPEVDVYVTGAEDALGGTPATFDFGGIIDLDVVPAGTYRIRVTPAGAAAEDSSVVYDSGPVALPAGADLSIVAVDNTGPGASPIALLAVLADGTVLELRDGGVEAEAGLTAVHNAADAPTVCVVAAAEGIDRIELFAGVPFRGFGYLGEVPPGTYTVGLEVFDAQTGCAGSTVIEFDPVSLAAGAEATGVVVGSLGAGQLELLALADDLRPIATESRVRIVHGAFSAPEVDIYVVPAGTDITDPEVGPAFTAVPFLASTDFVALLPGEYDVFVTVAGTTTVAIALENVALEGGAVITAIASDPAEGEEGFGVIIIDHVATKAGG